MCRCPDLPGYDEGAWWVQDAAASLPARLLHAEAGERVADLCAAPGGKTAQLCLTGAQVVAVDRSAERLKRFTSNLERLGLQADAKVADVANFQAPPFDAILLDAPCSADRDHAPASGCRLEQARLGSDGAGRPPGKNASIVPPPSWRPGGRIGLLRLLDRAGGGRSADHRDPAPQSRSFPIAYRGRGNRRPQRQHKSAGELRTLPFHPACLEPRLTGLDGFFAARLIRRN